MTRNPLKFLKTAKKKFELTWRSDLVSLAALGAQVRGFGEKGGALGATRRPRPFDAALAWLDKPIMSMTRLALFALALFAAPALAADLPSQLPTLATQPLPGPDPWKGFYVGAGVSAGFSKGSKGQFGGETFAGYSKTYDNGFVLGAEFAAGYNPWLSPAGRFHGVDFAQGSVKLGYQMGALTPFVMGGAAIVKDTNFGAGTPSGLAAFNALFSGPGAYQPAAVMGAGFDYAVTDKVHVGMAVYLNNNGGAH